MKPLRSLLALALLTTACTPAQKTPDPFPQIPVANAAFGNDAPWFLTNIPFLEIDDPAIQRTYYYRWQLYRAHIRSLGPHGTTVTEFLPSVPWARHPYEDLNDSSSFHLLEGRWLRNPAYAEALVDHLYTGGGNDRHFSESIAAATLAFTEVTGDPAPAVRHLDAMQHIYNLWDDHFDAARNLYWIEPLLDATEYTIASIDASGAGFTNQPDPKNNGFFGGQSFRPTINSFQYGNARAIAAIAQTAGRPALAADFNHRADALATATLQQLWNPALHHFTDIYQRTTPTVTAGTFVRGRELEGLVPWQFNLPPTHGDIDYAAAWQHALNPAELAGPHGLRTVEPTYARYLQQYRFDASTGLRECQWNGPSWPFQTSQALSGLANLLHSGSPQTAITRADYLHLLRQYTAQHQLRNGTLDLQEDYDPDTGAPIVGLPRSHHYNHSTYIDLVLTGLLGIHPRSDETLELDPLLPTPSRSSDTKDLSFRPEAALFAAGAEKPAFLSAATNPTSTPTEPPIRYFALQHLRYHNHDLTLLYDADGTRYHRGPGLTVISDGRTLATAKPLGHLTIPLGPTRLQPTKPLPANLAVNVWARQPSAFEPDLPIASASSTSPDSDLYHPLDGRTWFFPQIPHGWSPTRADTTPTYTVDLRHPQTIASVQLAFFADGKTFQAPTRVHILAPQPDGTWYEVAAATPEPNTTTTIPLVPTHLAQLRITFDTAPTARIRLVSVGAFAPPQP